MHDSSQHMTSASTAGIEAFDFASAQLNSPELRFELPDPTLPDVQQLDAGLDRSTWSCSMMADPVSPLKDRLTAAAVCGDGGRLFIPDDALRNILSPHVVFHELQKHYFCDLSAQDLQKMTGQITAKPAHRAAKTLLRMFAVLILLDKADKILEVSREGLSDASLPLSKVSIAKSSTSEQVFELRPKTGHATHLKCFEKWSQHDISALEKLQWRVVVPIFSETPNKQVDFLDLDDQTILPFIRSWQDTSRKGGNSEVWKVQISDSHHTFQNLNAAVPNNPYFAIKKLKSKDEEAFQREVRNLQRLYKAEHPNLLNLLATYKYCGHYHLVFTWADSDLRRLWRSSPNPQARKEETRWLAQQCASIASALSSVHAGAESWMQNGAGDGDGPSDTQRMAMNKYGIHGDIKPENIFIFSKGQQKSFKALAMGPPSTTATSSPSSASEDSSSVSISPPSLYSRSSTPSPAADDCVMTIGDFGGGEFFHHSNNPNPLHQITTTYRPPEHDTKLRPMSRSWDVWGLGCTYLEFATWFLLGPSGLTEFAKRRTTRTASGKLSDEYFETFTNANGDGAVGAFLKEPVLAWIHGLSRHKNASPFIRDFLHFITHRMFIVEDASLTRASGAEVASHLNELVRRCFDNEDYCVARTASQWSWPYDSTENSLALLPSATPEELTNLPFMAMTEDVGASAWHLSSLGDMNNMAQWDTAPIIHSLSHASLNCTDMLGNWNFTAPVAWNVSSTSNNVLASVETKRKRAFEDVSHDFVRRVSPKISSSTAGSSSMSPETRRSSSAIESPVVDGSVKKEVDKKFACPYYKNNPLKFRHKRTCCGPGWPTVHRVKEHLYRCHTIGKHTCSRCLHRFKNAAELLAHTRAAVPCDTITDAFPEGTMLPSQEEVLRVKKRVPPNTTEESRWAEVYMVLFSDADASSLPTPFYEDETTETRQTSTGMVSSKVEDEDSTASAWFCSPSDYEQYLSSSLPPRVQRELERQVQQELGFDSDERQTQKVVDVIKMLQLSLFEQFRQGRTAVVAQPEEGG